MTNESENAEARFSYVKADKLRVAATLYRFIEDEALPKTGIDSALFWPVSYTHLTLPTIYSV